MERLHRHTAIYWFFAVCLAVFWLFGASITGMALSMSLTGRIDGGALPNAIVTMLVLIWIGMVTAFDVAFWRARHLPSYVQLMSLARAPRPIDSHAATVWWWTRAAWYGFLAFLASLLLITAFVSLFGPWQ